MLAGKTDSLAGSEDAQLAILLEVSEDDAFVVMVGIERFPGRSGGRDSGKFWDVYRFCT
jgi:hypothetical protein